MQCVTVPKMLNDTDTDTFFRYQIFSIPIPVLFPVPNFFRYRFRDFFRYQILPIPVPRLFSGTKFFRYRFRYHQKKWKIPGSGTGTHYKFSKFKKICDKNLLRYQIFPIPVPRPFSGTKFFRYRFRDFFPVPNFSDTGSETFFRYQFFPIPVPIPPKKLKIPGTGTSHSDPGSGEINPCRRNWYWASGNICWAPGLTLV